jgi:hypothetical protein
MGNMITIGTTGFLFLLLAAGPSPEPAVTPPEEPEAVRMVVVEGVAAGSQAAPVAVLREIGERFQGRSFSIMYGKYLAFAEDGISPPLETSRTRLLSVEQLRTGLFKATMEVEIPSGLEERLARLREQTQRGAGNPEAGGLILAREEAREDALEKAILAAVAEQYPGDSAPARLVGRAYFLGTIREEIEEGRYVILARVKVRLVKP